MRKHFTKYLVEDLGFKSFRCVKGSYVPNTILDFSTMQEGGVDLRFIKGDEEIIWGLHQYGKPPTLIHPRPSIRLSKVNPEGRLCISYEIDDDAMNICLSEEEPEKIYEALYNKEITFRYKK